MEDKIGKQTVPFQLHLSLPLWRWSLAHQGADHHPRCPHLAVAGTGLGSVLSIGPAEDFLLLLVGVLARASEVAAGRVDEAAESEGCYVGSQGFPDRRPHLHHLLQPILDRSVDRFRHPDQPERQHRISWLVHPHHHLQLRPLPLLLPYL